MSAKTRRLADIRVGAPLPQVDVYVCISVCAFVFVCALVCMCVCVNMYMSVAVKSGQLGRILTCVGQMGIAVCSPRPETPKRATAPLPPSSRRRVLDYSAPKSGEDLPRWCLEDTSLAVRSLGARLFQGHVKNSATIKQSGMIARTNIQGRTNCKPNCTK